MDTTTVHGLLVFLDLGLETTISSNMVPTSSQRMRVVLRRSHSRGLTCRLRSGSCRLALVSEAMPEDNERSGDTKTGVRSYHNPHHQGKGESTKHLAAHQEQNEHGEKGQSAGEDGSRQSLVDRSIDQLGELHFAQQAAVFANTIKNHDRVVHRITNQGQESCDDRQRNFEMQQREKSQRDQNVVKHGEDRRCPENPLESEGNI